MLDALFMSTYTLNDVLFVLMKYTLASCYSRPRLGNFTYLPNFKMEYQLQFSLMLSYSKWFYDELF